MSCCCAEVAARVAADPTPGWVLPVALVASALFILGFMAWRMATDESVEGEFDL